MTQNIPNYKDSKIAIIGAGPSGLMAAEVLSNAGYAPIVFDAKPSAGRKFLQAGRGGLNLTHSEDFSVFCSRYFEAQHSMQKALNIFSPDNMREWAKSLGFETFVGSSGKVYPLNKKAAPLLRTWIQKLKANNTKFKMNYNFIGFSKDVWKFQTPDGVEQFKFDVVILALGGASWPQLGSTGEWTKTLKEKGLNISELRPANMGFNVNHSKVFKDKFSRTPLKNVQLSFSDINDNHHSKLGELLVTEFGIEGNLIYAHSKYIRELLELKTPTIVYLDLFVHTSESKLRELLSAQRGKQSLSAFWKRLGLDGVRASLLREVLDNNELNKPDLVAKTLKNYPLTLESCRPLQEAISTAGGLKFDNLDDNLMLKDFTGVFCVGEMLDWEAQTGGYLLTGVMAQGKQAALGILKYLQKNHDKDLTDGSL